MNDETLEALLQAADRSAAVGGPSQDLGERVRRRHEQSQRRRRRISLAAGLTACYLAGLLTMWAWTRTAPSDPGLAHDQETEQPVPQTRSEPASNQTAEPSEARKLAHAAEPVLPPIPSAYQRMRELGDEYLLRRGDVELALEFYRRALDSASEEELRSTDDEDTWLLTSLKRDRSSLKSNGQMPMKGDS